MERVDCEGMRIARTGSVRVAQVDCAGIRMAATGSVRVVRADCAGMRMAATGSVRVVRGDCAGMRMARTGSAQMQEGEEEEEDYEPAQVEQADCDSMVEEVNCGRAREAAAVAVRMAAVGAHGRN